MASLSSIITQTVGTSTAGVNLISAPNDSSIWTVSVITKSTTTLAAELPLGPAIPTATKFSLAASPGTAYVDVDCPTALLNWSLQLGWFARASAGFTAAIAIASIKSYASSANRTSDTSGTTIVPRNSTVSGLATSFQTTFDTSLQQYYRITLSFAAQASAWYSICQVQVGPGNSSQSSIAIDWQTISVTPSSGVWGAVANTASFMRRVGSDMHLRVAFTFGTPAIATAAIPMPTGYTINTSVLPASSRGRLGQWEAGGSSATMGSNNRAGVAFTDGSTTNTIFLAILDDTTGYVKSNASAVTNANSFISIEVVIPIAEWAGQSATMGPGANIQVYSSTSTPGAGWDAPAAAANTVAGLSPITGTLGAARAKVVRLPYAPQSISDIKIVFIPSGFSAPIGQETWAPYVGTQAVDFGVKVSALSGTDVTVTFFQFKTQGSTFNNTAGATPWSAGDGAWGLIVSNPSVQPGMIAGTDGSSGFVAPYTEGSGVVYAGRFTPTLTGVTNVSGTATANSCHYSRVGKIVTVSGSMAIATTAAASTSTQVDISLPIASNLTSVTDLAGTGVRDSSSGTALQACYVRASAANDRAELFFASLEAPARSLSFTFQYEVK